GVKLLCYLRRQAGCRHEARSAPKGRGLAVNTARPFRFGAVFTDSYTARQWTEQARRLEADGFATLLVADHYANAMACGPLLLAAAQATTTLRVGSYVYNNDFRRFRWVVMRCGGAVASSVTDQPLVGPAYRAWSTTVRASQARTSRGGRGIRGSPST